MFNTLRCKVLADWEVVWIVPHNFDVVVACVLKTSCLFQRAVSAESLSGTTNNMADGGAKVCHNRTPCGWAVYTPFTRTVDYFMKNTWVSPIALLAKFISITSIVMKTRQYSLSRGWIWYLLCTVFSCKTY